MGNAEIFPMLEPPKAPPRHRWARLILTIRLAAIVIAVLYKMPPRD
jgi:hypothetical protein